MLRKIIIVLGVLVLIGLGWYQYYGRPYFSNVNNLEWLKNLNVSYSWTYYDEDLYSQFENTKYGISLIFPKEYFLTQTADQYGSLTNILATVSLPDEKNKDTNLYEASLKIGASQDEDIVAKCLVPDSTLNEQANGERKIKYWDFKIFQRSGVATGNLYESTSYRVVQNNTCYEAIIFLHSGNLATFDSSLGVKEFDHSKITEELESILSKLSIK